VLGASYAPLVVTVVEHGFDALDVFDGDATKDVWLIFV
jgi:hypothetical protein